MVFCISLLRKPLQLNVKSKTSKRKNNTDEAKSSRKYPVNHSWGQGIKRLLDNNRVLKKDNTWEQKRGEETEGVTNVREKFKCKVWETPGWRSNWIEMEMRTQDRRGEVRQPDPEDRGQNGRERGKTGRQWRRPEGKGRRGGAIVSRILPKLLQETKVTGALATTFQRTPKPDTSLWNFLSLIREGSESMQKESGAQWMTLNVSQCRKLFEPQTKPPQAPNSDSNKFPVVKSESWIKFLPSWEKKWNWTTDD